MGQLVVGFFVGGGAAALLRVFFFGLFVVLVLFGCKCKISNKKK